MLKRSLIVFMAFAAVILSSCGKRHVPSKTATVTPAKTNTTGTVTKRVKPAPAPPKPDTAAVAAAPEEKPAPKPEPKPEFPKVITVNDNAASKSVDGRLFYDVLGHRYWKNYKDGKYYLFDKSMYSNPDFKPPK
jgi:hypothetical protein